MLEHGGRLRVAAQHYQIPLKNWVDLSTGINPNGWTIPSIPAKCWQRLPETEDGLLDAAQRYYRNHSILPIAGSQAGIQMLPHLRNHSRVGVLQPAYAEHASNWKKAGHDVAELSATDIDHAIPNLDVLIIVNPNNPTGQNFDRAQLLRWHQTLQQRRGWLIIDEAFIDSRPENSLSGHPVQEGLIILRSLGKFFGLAGIRCGFVIGPPALLQELDEALGPWSISHPSRYVASKALQDIQWQQQTRSTLPSQRYRLLRLMSNYGLTPDGGTDLFLWAQTKSAKQIHHFLAQRGILTRLFAHPSSLRFGLPRDEMQWNALERALAAYNRQDQEALS